MGKDDIFFIWGEEPYLIDAEVNKIVAVIENRTGDQVELVRLEADELTPQQLIESLYHSSLFSLQKIIIIKNPQWMGENVKKNARVEEFSQVLESYTQQTISGQTLILTAATRNASNPVIKLLDKKSTVLACKSPDSAYLSAWLKEQFMLRNRTPKSEVIKLLAGSNQDMYYLFNLIEKICLITSKKNIELADVEEYLDSNEEIKVFKMTDALLNRNLKNAMEAYYKLLAQGEHPIFFLYMVVRQFTLLGKIKYYQEKGYNRQQMQEMTGQKDFTIRKMTEKADKFKWLELRQLFESFLQADICFKTTGQDDKMVMENLIIEICNKK